jgi:hypothetical protein
MFRFVLLVFLPLGAVSLAFADSTGEMLSSCKKVAEGKVENGQAVFQPDFDTGKCWGAFASLQVVTNIIVPPGKQPTFGICGPKGSTRTQDIAIFIEYAQRNPQRLHENFVFVALDALRLAFPCHK